MGARQPNARPKPMKQLLPVHYIIENILPGCNHIYRKISGHAENPPAVKQRYHRKFLLQHPVQLFGRDFSRFGLGIGGFRFGIVGYSRTKGLVGGNQTGDIHIVWNFYLAYVQIIIPGGNSGRTLLDANYCPNTYFAGNSVENNSLTGGMFYMGGSAVMVEGCAFSGNSGPWYTAPYLFSQEESMQAVDAQGQPLSESQLQSMERFTVEGWQPTDVESSKPAAAEDGYVHVSTVDEFLAAIAPNTAIYLEDGDYDLSSAASYGGYGSQYYLWKDTGVDGPQLVICNLRGLSITGGGADKASIIAKPRYAEVLAFDNCQDISLSGFTAGHSQAPGSCIGGVLYFNNTGNISIESCSLYGCGVWGITAIDCNGLQVKTTEIYECSSGDLNLTRCKSVSIEDCDFHDNGFSRVVDQCSNAFMDGELLLSCSPPSARALKAESIAPGQLIDDELYIYYFGAVSQLTLPDAVPIRLSAQVLGDMGPDTVEDPVWTVSDESKLSLEPGKHGVCVVENLGNTGGSVTVTAEYEGKTAQVKINFVKQLPDVLSPYSLSPASSANAVVTPTPSPAPAL